MDQKRDSEISKAVLENIKLRNRVRRSEFQLKEREELGDGLHLIDFEQLKIENQTFLEKIEERNEEVEKLRKKITVMVQVLTHVKEKLEFIRSENSELQNDLSAIDQEISEHRDNLPAMKSKRDRLRKENQDIRSQSGLLGHKHLLKDLELKMVS
jgi:chromosome segregation ATPase